MYIYERPEWPHFTWRREQLEPLLGAVRHQQGRVMGHMEALGFSTQAQATLQTLMLDVLKSSEIEGEVLPADRHWRGGWEQDDFQISEQWNTTLN